MEKRIPCQLLDKNPYSKLIDVIRYIAKRVMDKEKNVATNTDEDFCYFQKTQN